MSFLSGAIMHDTAKRDLIERYLDAYNRKDVEAMLATVHQDVSFDNIANGTTTASTRGVAALRELALQSVGLFSERRQTIAGFAARDGGAAIAVAFHAVVAEDLPNGLKKGQVLELAGRSEFRFEDGKIRAITDIS
jgi:ketosteroid isomerase-like protein